MHLDDQTSDRVLHTLVGLSGELRRLGPKELGLTLIADTALEILPGEGSSLRLLDADRNHFVAVARAGQPVHRPGTALPANMGVIGWVAQTAKSAHVSDTREDDRFETRKEQLKEVRSLVCVPLVFQGRVLGVLGVTHSAPDAFEDNSIYLLGLLASCAVQHLAPRV